MPHDTSALQSARVILEHRRARLMRGLGRPAEPASIGASLPPERLEFFRREAEDLYWNELSWEELTDEEAICGGHLTELVFPGFLAFVEGLLFERVRVDADAFACPHPDAVETILEFLAGRGADLSAEVEAGADSQRLIWARAMTLRLIDLVLYRLYRLSAAEQEQLEAAL